MKLELFLLRIDPLRVDCFQAVIIKFKQAILPRALYQQRNSDASGYE
jgi:hypothetical protein